MDITPAVANGFVDALRRRGIQFIVAPFEADAQMVGGGSGVGVSTLGCLESQLGAARCTTEPDLVGWLTLPVLTLLPCLARPPVFLGQAYLALNGSVDVVVTEDSDLLTYGWVQGGWVDGGVR